MALLSKAKLYPNKAKYCIVERSVEERSPEQQSYIQTKSSEVQ